MNLFENNYKMELRESRIWLILFAIILTMDITIFFLYELSYASLGGILLLTACFFYYNGKIMYSNMLYIGGDFCWAKMAYDIDDMTGFALVNIAIVIGLLVQRKMHQGVFVKDLKTKKGN